MSARNPLLLSLAALVFASAVSHAQTADVALAAFKAGAWPQVFEAVKDVPANAADRPKALYVAGEAYLVVGDFAQAEASFRAVLAARPEAVPAKLGLGRALCARGELKEAEELLTELAFLETKDALVKQAAGVLLAKQNQPERARKLFVEALALEPKSAEIARAYCEFLWSTNADDDAAKVAAAFAKAQPKHAMTPFLQAIAFERANEPKKAIEAYEKVLVLDPKFLDAHKNLAILCHTRNPLYTDEARTKKALEHYAQYFELGGRDAGLRQSYEQFKAFMDASMGSTKKEPRSK
ncbi:MAG: tetratricopeptide repeat protein [Planctomycetes bacterium]|nr:tetratricopeptide repeat protein [Planctomycetota bacterium]